MKISSLAAALLLGISAHSALGFEGILTYTATDVGYVAGTSGWSFVPTTPISVTSLGCFDYVLSVNQNPLLIGLWASDGTLLASHNVSTASPLLNQTHYESISPVSLNAGLTYYLGAYSAAQGIVVLNASEPTSGGVVNTSANIQLGQAGANFSGFAVPNNLQGSPGSAFLTANFQYVVPEPSAAALWSLAAAALAWHRNRSKR